MSYKVEVIADGSGKWVGNGLRFETKREAELYAIDLACRWTLVRDWRTVETKEASTNPSFVKPGAVFWGTQSVNLREARELASWSTPARVSKMPGTSYGLPAQNCITGAKLAKVPGSVCHNCYALKGNYLFPSTREGHRRRLKAIENPLWVEAMVLILDRWHATPRPGQGFHRWHDSGDLQSQEHLGKIVEVAWATPGINHWLPTREAGIVARNVYTVPPNLCIRVSATMVDGAATKAWPTTSGVHTSRPPGGEVCPAPQQGNKCGSCRACWSHKVPHVSYHLH